MKANYSVMAMKASIAMLAFGLAQAQQPTGDAAFPLSAREAREIEGANALPRSRFYDTESLPEGKPGDLIRTEECADYLFPYTPALPSVALGIKVVRFLYYSRQVSGKLVPASGVILTPYGRPPEGGWPVVVWAHGTSGVGRRRAPSLMKDIYYSWASPLAWTMLGYAVVAPDYAGLGTSVPHEYLAGPAQAQDVIHAVPAARKAVKELGVRWLAIGHSQGGLAVMTVAEMQGELKDPNYLGAVAIAPPGDFEPIAEHVHGTANRGLLTLLAYGMKSIYSDFNYSDFLTQEALELMPTIEDAGLLESLAAIAEKVPAGKVLKPDWKNNTHFQKIRKLSMLGERPVFRSVLLIHGEAEELIPTNTMEALYERMKAQKSQVEFLRYESLAHDPLVFGSFRDQLRWVQDRFAGRPMTIGMERK